MSGETYTFKIVVGGAGGVGKTTLLHRYMHDVFKADTRLTVGVTLQTTEVARNGHKITLAMWDLGGQDRFRFMQPDFCKGALAGIVFFDMSRLGTMLQVQNWATMFRKHASPDIPIVLGGAKLDLADDVVKEDVDKIAKETVSRLGLMAYVPTSSKSGEGVHEIIEQIVDTLLDRAKGASLAPPQALPPLKGTKPPRRIPRRK
ncbi:MAG: GTP-binding protein [Candidatus Lokiarchaeota archaeon]|nr:GTP-binding protein [Candidatus Lokiarchaeota archaeon]